MYGRAYAAEFVRTTRPHRLPIRDGDYPNDPDGR